MRTFYVVLIATIFTFVYTDDNNWVPWEEAHMRVFDGDENMRTVEDSIKTSLEQTKNFFARDDIKNTLQVFTLGTANLPFVGQLFSIVSTCAGMLESETEWKDKFTLVIIDEMKKGHVNNDLSKMGDVVHSIKNRLPFLNRTVAGKEKKKITSEVVSFATDIFSRLEEMIISFAKPDSPHKRYPLISGPFLSELGMLVASFEPIAIKLLQEASSSKLSCQIRDATFDYLPFLLAARFENTNIDLWKSKRVRRMPYNPNGYNDTKQLECEHVGDRKIENYEKEVLKDEFGSLKYYKRHFHTPCEDSYAQHLRYLVEKSFPLEVLNLICDRKMENSTGKIH